MMGFFGSSKSKSFQDRETPLSGFSLLKSLVIIGKHSGLELSLTQLIADHNLALDRVSIEQVLEIARASGFRARWRRVTWRELAKFGRSFPGVVFLRSGYAMVVQSLHADATSAVVTLQDPNANEAVQLTLDEHRFTAAWTGDLLLFKRIYGQDDEDRPWSTWLVAREILKSKGLLWDIAIAALPLTFLSIAPILFYRLLMDRVLMYQNLNTLAVMCLAMIILVAFETALSYLRRLFVLHITQRVDVKLSTSLFNKILWLPMEFLDRTPIGTIAQYMHEFNKTRTFLMHFLFGTLLDSLVLLLIFPIMFALSPLLTSCVLMWGVLICAWLIYKLPEIRRRTAAAVGADTAKNSFLIESLHGMRTIKAMALDTRRRHHWDKLVAASVRARFAEGLTHNHVLTGITPLERMMTAGVLALAVYMSVDGPPIYLGALFAFFLLSQRVSQPLVQLAQSLIQIDEFRAGIAMVADIGNRPSEEGHSKYAKRTPIAGRIEFSGVSFRYAGAPTLALNNVSFTIPEGTIFGIMGRSGSGKTTVTRLLQMFHGNYQGLINIDTTDLRQYNVDYLRSKFGIVSQENFLFSGTIRDTISSTKPGATFDEIVTAARVAGAEEFIDRLAAGYNTFIFESSANLSGGQRQRLAIARALIGDPRILILDEATSALDAESEAIVNANLARIAEGRTMIVVSHRLSSLVNANAILVLEQGGVYDIGTHAELLERCDIYSNLWYQQNRHVLAKPLHQVVPFRAPPAP